MNEISLRVEEPPALSFAIGVNEKPTQAKSVTPAEVPQTVEPDAGFVLSRVDVAAVPWVRPQGEVEITGNGDVDVSAYASARVAVPVGVFPSGTKTISADGTYDVTAFAAAQVNTAPEKGVILSDYDTDGYPHTATLKWTGTIPSNFCGGFGQVANFTAKVEKLVVGDGVTRIENVAFRNSSSLKEVEMYCEAYINGNGLNSMHNVEKFTFHAPVQLNNPATGSKVALFDFSDTSEVSPLLAAVQGYFNHADGCVIRVPASLLDEWKAATNWCDLPTDPNVSGYVVWEGV